MATVLREKVMIEGLTLSAVIWKKFRRQPDGFIEKVIAMNIGVTDFETISVGTEITFPIEEIAAVQRDTKIVRLWDDD